MNGLSESTKEITGVWAAVMELNNPHKVWVVCDKKNTYSTERNLLKHKSNNVISCKPTSKQHAQKDTALLSFKNLLFNSCTRFA